MTNPANEGFLQVWISALTQPRGETYTRIAASSRARATTGYLWVFLASILSTAVTLLVQGSQIGRELQQTGLGPDRFQGVPGGISVALLCVAPFAAVFVTLFFAIWVALVQWIARMFGGRGTNDQLAYTLAAITAPYSIVSSVFVLLSAIPYIGLCFNVVLALAGLYILFLHITAIKAVNQFGWGGAIGAYLIPGFAVFLVCCCAVAVLASVAGVAFGDIWSTINQSLPSFQ
jgi:hypothetical protein